MFEELSLHILDIGMNSLRADARRIEIVVIENAPRDWLILRVRDDGHGMDPATVREVLARHNSTKRSRKKGIGLGLALLRHTAEMCGGTFHLHSRPGKGTTVTASMRRAHVDRPPLGDLNATVLALCAANPAVDVQLHCRSNGSEFHFSSQTTAPKGDNTHEHRRTPEAKRKSPTARLVA
jgi:hypothetical protein